MITNNSPVTEGEGLSSNQALTQPVLELVASVGCWVRGKSVIWGDILEGGNKSTLIVGVF